MKILKQIFKNYKQTNIQNTLGHPREYRAKLSAYHFRELIYDFDFLLTSSLYANVIKQLEAIGICCKAFELLDLQFIKLGIKYHKYIYINPNAEKDLSDFFVSKMSQMADKMVYYIDMSIVDILHEYLNNHKDKYVLQFSNLDPVIDDIKSDLENKLKTM